jgi:hypothetical protein
VTVWIVLRRSKIRHGVFGRRLVKYKELEIVVLDKDLPEHGLRLGDLGTVVHVYPPSGVEVEFVTASGRTETLVTLDVRDVRPVVDEDMISVRSFRRFA